MERNVPLIRSVLGALALMLALCALVRAAMAADEPRLVLVASATSPLTSLSVADVRRLYLGIPLTQFGREITPLRNASNAVVKEMFLQHVLFMSAQAYERQISSRVYRSGGNRIPEYTQLGELIESLAAQPFAVTYMLHETALRYPRIKILSEL